MPPSKSLKRPLLWSALLSLLALPLLFLWGLGAAPACVVKRLLGIPCPGCGLGRAGQALLAGDPLTALFWYPAWPGLLALYLLGLAATIALLRGRPAGASTRWLAPLGIGTAVLVLLSWGARLAGVLGY